MIAVFSPLVCVLEMTSFCWHEYRTCISGAGIIALGQGRRGDDC